MYVKQLPERPEYGVCLRCTTCGETYSASRGDYFLRSPEHLMKCCGRPLRLVRKVERWESVSPAEVRS